MTLTSIRRLSMVVVGVAFIYVLVVFGGARSVERTFAVGVVSAVAAFGCLLAAYEGWRGHKLSGIICLGSLAFGYLYWRQSTAPVTYAAQMEFSWFLGCLAVAVAASSVCQASSTVRVLLLALLVVGMLEALYGIAQWLRGSTNVLWVVRPGQYGTRASGTFINPNHFAALLAMLIPIALSQLLLSRCSAAWKVLYAYSALVMTVGVAASGSRSGALACAAGICLVLTLFFVTTRCQRWRWMVTAGIMGLLLLGAITSKDVRVRFDSWFGEKSWAQVEVRAYLWKAGWQMWKDNPWMGVGPGHYDVRFPQYRDMNVQTRPIWPHSEYVGLLAEHGVVGVSLVTALGVAVLALGRGRWNQRDGDAEAGREQRSDRWSGIVGIAGGLCAALVQMAGDFTAHIPGTAWAAAILLGLLLGGFDKGRPSRSGWRGRAMGMSTVVAGLVLTFALTGNSWMAIKTWQHQQLFKQAKDSATWETKVELLRRTIAIAPDNPETRWHLGELLRLKSFRGDPGYEVLAEEAMVQFREAIRLNPFEPLAAAHLGMCLDWLNRHDEADAWFERARELDPNRFRVIALQGWHQFQKEDYVGALEFFRQALNKPHIARDPLAEIYWPLTLKKLQENARTQ
jgi:O-antigen ligase